MIITYKFSGKIDKIENNNDRLEIGVRTETGGYAMLGMPYSIEADELLEYAGFKVGTKINAYVSTPDLWLIEVADKDLENKNKSKREVRKK